MKRARIGMFLVVALCLVMGSTRKSQTAAALASIDRADQNLLPEDQIIVLAGYCVAEKSGSKYRLTGYCGGKDVGIQICSTAPDASQCPPGLVAKQVRYLRCGECCFNGTVDLTRPCATRRSF